MVPVYVISTFVLLWMIRPTIFSYKREWIDSVLLAVLLSAPIKFWGMLFLLVLFMSVRPYIFTYHHQFKQWALGLLSTSIMVGLMIHTIPGFSNPKIFDAVVLSPLSTPYSMYFNFDKVLGAFILFAVLRLDREEAKLNLKAFGQTVGVLLACIITILGPALLSGIVKLDIKFPPEFGLWALNNLFFVCFAEEVIFRGVLQRKLTQKLGAIAGIVLASIIFGLFHIKSGGPVYMVLAAVCGLFYGYVYHKTQSIRCSMMVHFGLNAIHFLAFTYPSAARLG